MRVVVAAIGRLKQGPERELAERYRKRAADIGRRIGIKDVEIVEIKESRAPDAGKRMIEESIALANLIPDKAAAVLLEERGQDLGSAALTDRLRRWRDGGTQDVVFVIGGATWPHQLVRIMLLEQLYRAMTILAGHPYHRA
jgi:23S rRNA (pseudouridine1915-N3)-methyltransferase